MRHATVSAMLVMAAAMPARAQAQSDWWDWTLSHVAVQVRVDVGDTRAPLPARVVYREPGRVAMPRGGYDDGRYGDRDYDDVRGRYGKKGKGPAFCRSGAGHPVHGRRWCLEKGFGLGDRRGYAVRWERTRWDDVVFGRAWYRGRADYVDGRHLAAVVGPRSYDRLDAMRRRMGSREALSGRWVRPRNGVLVLQVRSGLTPIAELTDLNLDGRVDVVMVARW